MKYLSIFLLLAFGVCFAQNRTGGSSANDPNQGAQVPSGAGANAKAPVKKPSVVDEQEALRKRMQIIQAEKDGIEVRVKSIAHFRGIRSNQIMGTGLVVGLAGSGDTKKSVITQQIVTNL